MTEPIRTAIVGLGRAGWSIHVENLRGRQDYTIVAVVDPDAERREEAVRELGCRAYADLDSCLAESDAELVIVANRSLDHAATTIQALQAGRHVMVEKPMALNTAEADAMIAAAEAAGRILTIHQNRRLDPEVLYIQKVIADGTLGRVFEIKIGSYGFARRNDWQTVKAFGGGLLNNWGPHLLDNALVLLGAPVEEVLGDLQRVACIGDAEDHVKIVLVGRNRRLVDLELTSGCALPLPSWVVMGDCGTMVIRDGESHLRYFDPAQTQPLGIDTGNPTGRRYGNDDVLPWQERTEPARVEPETDLYTNLFGAIRRGEPLIVKAEQIREMIRIMGEVRAGTEFAL